MSISYISRMGAILLPVLVSWFVIAPWFGLFQQEIIKSPGQLWRPALAMTFSVPLALVIRGLILDAPIIPVFAMVLWGVYTFGVIVWRTLFFALTRK